MERQTILDPKKECPEVKGLCALGIMTKAPQAGKVKTRLSPPLTAKEAAGLNACFLRDLGSSIDQASSQSPAGGVAIYTPLGEERVYQDILPEDFLLIPQRGDGFGERLLNATADLFDVGFASVCLINSDSPTVPAASFAEAVNKLGLDGDKIVLGPSDDGGYFLIGMKKLHARVFEQIDWSTERVFEQTIDRAREIGIKVDCLPSGFDVDDRATLFRLCEELLGQETGLIKDIAPNTRRFLADIVANEGRDRIWPK